VNEIIGYLIASAPGLLAAGGLFVKVARLERDVEQRVSKELFDLHMRTLEKELAEIKALLMPRSRFNDTTDPGGRT
jgi:hypothetical protein